VDGKFRVPADSNASEPVHVDDGSSGLTTALASRACCPCLLMRRVP
jgi:hypothetical protein